jgi:hypothetical protein
LTNAAIYWFTETAGSAARMYHEEEKAAYGSKESQDADKKADSVPAAICIFPNDVQSFNELA